MPKSLKEPSNHPALPECQAHMCTPAHMSPTMMAWGLITPGPSSTKRHSGSEVGNINLKTRLSKNQNFYVKGAKFLYLLVYICPGPLQSPLLLNTNSNHRVSSSQIQRQVCSQWKCLLKHPLACFSVPTQGPRRKAWAEWVVGQQRKLAGQSEMGLT